MRIYLPFILLSLAAQSAFVFAKDDYMPMQLVNNSGYADEAVYFIAHAISPQTGEDCFLKFDQTSGIAECVPATLNSLSADYSYTFNQFKNKALHIPLLNSGRLYISLGYPLTLWTEMDAFNQIKIVSLDGFKMRDPNFYTLYDKIEFSHAPNGLFINPTAVDFFTLPLRITHSQASGELKASGLSQSQRIIFEKIDEVLEAFDETPNDDWQKLLVYFGGDKNVPLRFMSPGKAMVYNNPASFNIHYLDNDRFDYIQFVWDYYKAPRTLTIDAKEIAPSEPPENYLFTGHVAANGIDFVFTSQGPHKQVVIKKPVDSIPFFAGGSGTFNHEDLTPEAIIVKNITAALSVGLLPIESEPDEPEIILNHEYFREYKKHSPYFENNKVLTELNLANGGPWYDLYGKALHSFDNEPIYTFAYDDHLAQDGTLHVNRGISEATLVTLNKIDTAIPNPYTHTNYDKVQLVSAGTNEVKVVYNDQLIPPGSELLLEDVTTPIFVTVNDVPIAIYIEYPVVVVDPHYPYSVSAGDIVINKTHNPQVPRIEFPSEWK